MWQRHLARGLMLAAGIVLADACKRQAPVAPQKPAPSWTWQRYAGNPVLLPENIPAKPGAKYPVMADPTLMFDEGKFKMWFGYGGQDKVGDPKSVRVRTGYAESQDGIAWKLTAPALDAGSGWDRTNAETPCVVKDETVPEGHPRKYRLYYSGLDWVVDTMPFEKLVERGMGYGIGLAFSGDGKHFTRIPASESPYGVAGLVLKPNPPVLDRDAWDFLHVADPHVLKKDGRYHIWYGSFAREAKTGKAFNGISYASSDDGITWVKHGQVVKPDLKWEVDRRKEPFVGRPYVLWKDGKFEMFYDSRIEDDNPFHSLVAGLGFAWSADGHVWKKESQPVFVTNHGRGEKLGLIGGSAILYQNGTYYLYYPGADPDRDRFVLNLATWKPKS